MRIDFSPLEAPVERPVLVPRRTTDAPRLLYVAAVFSGVGGGFTAVTAFGLAVKTAYEGGPGAELYALLGVFPLVLLAAAIVGVVTWRRTHIRPVPSLAPNLPAFAAANGLELIDEFPFALPGQLFTPVIPGLTSSPKGFRGLRPTRGRPFIVGDRWTTPAGSSVRITTPFVAVQLDRSLPRTVLVPRGIDPQFDLDRSQHLSLEGDFDKYFTLFCPEDYETDALVVYTPDVMAAMVDGAQGWIAETADDWLVFRRPGTGFDSATVDDYRRAFELVATAAPDVVEQSVHYSDDRVGDRAIDRIAEQGRTLRAGRVWWTPLAGVGLFLTCVAPIAIGFVPLFVR